MSRKASRAPADAGASATAQAVETKPRPVDDDGRILDGHGLPLSGPARIRALDGRPDPARPDADPVAPPPEGAPVDVSPADQPPAGQAEESE